MSSSPRHPANGCRYTLHVFFLWTLLAQGWPPISSLTEVASLPSPGAGASSGEACLGYTEERLQELLGRTMRLREQLQRTHDLIGEGELLQDEIAVPAHTGGELIRSVNPLL